MRRGAVRITLVSIILFTLLYVSLRYKLGAMKKKYPKVAEFSQRAQYKNYSLNQPKNGKLKSQVTVSYLLCVQSNRLYSCYSQSNRFCSCYLQSNR